MLKYSLTDNSQDNNRVAADSLEMSRFVSVLFAAADLSR
jgi:hypothetical protein